MKRILSRLRSLLRRRRRSIATGPVPVMLGQALPLPLAMRVLAETKAEALRARSNNYWRSVRRLLDCVKN